MNRGTTTNRLALDLDNALARTETLWQELRGQRILITGATGFFGCWLLETFAWANRRLDLNARAVAVARHPQALAQKAPHLARDRSIALYATDVRRDVFPQDAFSHVIHAATEASATLNRKAPLVMFDTIVEGTRRTLEFAAAKAVRKLLFVSSGAVYGTQPPELTHLPESFSGGPDPLDPSNAYAEGKRAAELLCSLAATSALEIKIARCFAFVGPYMQLDAHFAIGNFINDRINSDRLNKLRLDNDRPPRGTICVQGDGSAVRSYLFASDLMVWLWTILFKGESRRAYNVGSEDAVNIAALAHEVAAALPPAVNVEIASTPTPGAPVHRYVPSTARAREELGLCAEVTLREGIRRTYQWFSGKSPVEREIPKADVAARGSHA
jgi:nucleoside-diphosphate-sugar epimerase